MNDKTLGCLERTSSFAVRRNSEWDLVAEVAAEVRTADLADEPRGCSRDRLGCKRRLWLHDFVIKLPHGTSWNGPKISSRNHHCDKWAGYLIPVMAGLRSSRI